MVKRRRRCTALKVTGDGNGVANHAGARLLVDLADAVGVRSGLSAAMAPTKLRRRGHDRGEVLVDLAVAIADGAETKARRNRARLDGSAPERRLDPRPTSGAGLRDGREPLAKRGPVAVAGHARGYDVFAWCWGAGTQGRRAHGKSHAKGSRLPRW